MGKAGLPQLEYEGRRNSDAILSGDFVLYAVEGDGKVEWEVLEVN